ncbi:M23 family metallopeptidase [Kitasatospora sp. NPDC094015]|uniref:M23 family metallopeptidase n=1 Tax=Kitasatospora sp. NPDC094015 TaxID=3155205 RepID=UPI00332DAC26
MASTHPLQAPAAGTQLLDHPVDQHLPVDHGGEASRHRMPRQARSGAPLLGVTAMTAALGATGFASAAQAHAAPAPAVFAADAAADRTDGSATAADPGLALAARIQQQADGQGTSVEESARLAAAQEAEAKRAAQQAAPAPVAPAPAVQGGTAPTLPVTGYTLGAAHPGQTGSLWSHLHTGLDFTAPAGTPVGAVAAGTVSSAGWSGAYGYRVIQTLPDGTELWYCHLAGIATTGGAVAPGTLLGAVGATGNVTSPHLHLEVRPGGGAPVDPLGWLRAHGLQP